MSVFLLSKAEKKSNIILCWILVFLRDDLNNWNHSAILEVLSRKRCVKAKRVVRDSLKILGKIINIFRNYIHSNFFLRVWRANKTIRKLLWLVKMKCFIITYIFSVIFVPPREGENCRLDLSLSLLSQQSGKYRLTLAIHGRFCTPSAPILPVSHFISSHQIWFLLFTSLATLLLSNFPPIRAIKVILMFLQNEITCECSDMRAGNGSEERAKCAHDTRILTISLATMFVGASELCDAFYSFLFCLPFHEVNWELFLSVFHR